MLLNKKKVWNVFNKNMLEGKGNIISGYFWDKDLM